MFVMSDPGSKMPVFTQYNFLFGPLIFFSFLDAWNIGT